jgi:hypothetical protein
MRIRHPRPVYVVRTVWPAEAIAGALAALPRGGTGTFSSLATLYAASSKKIDDQAILLMTDRESWNETRPIPTRDPRETPRWVPQYKRPKPDDPNNGTVQEKRHGPFPIGVALEAEVPRDWYDGDMPKKPVKVRLAVLGSGGIFLGERVPAMREKMFVDVSNWLLGRDNLLASDNEIWQYPRVHLDDEIRNLWEWSARLGLPLLFIYCGMLVWLVRRMR